MIIIRALFLLSFILMIPNYVLGQSAISFDANGRWACSFKAEDFPEDIYQDKELHALQPMPVDGLYFYYPGGNQGGCGGQSAIRAADNHTAGEGDRAYRIGIGDGVNQQDSQLQIFFPQSPEVWIRFYVKWDEGLRWDYLNYQKLLSIFNSKSKLYQVLVLTWENRMDIAFARTNPNDNENPYAGEWVKGNGGGWMFMFGSPSPGERHAYSDGSWHSIEMYAKMNSALGVYDGKAAIWVDGQLIVKEETVLWDSGGADDINGFNRYSFNVNQREPGNAIGPIGSSCAYTYYDDIVIYNQTPPNVDAHGNPFIGPLYVAPPKGLHIKITN